VQGSLDAVRAQVLAATVAFHRTRQVPRAPRAASEAA